MFYWKPKCGNMWHFKLNATKWQGDKMEVTLPQSSSDSNLSQLTFQLVFWGTYSLSPALPCHHLRHPAISSCQHFDLSADSDCIPALQFSQASSLVTCTSQKKVICCTVNQPILVECVFIKHHSHVFLHDIHWAGVFLTLLRSTYVFVKIHIK